MKFFKSILYKENQCNKKEILESNDEITLKVRNTIKKLCRLGSSRPRVILYDFLEKELNVKLTTLHSDNIWQKDHPRFECTNLDELCKETHRVVMKLKQKKNFIENNLV